MIAFTHINVIYRDTYFCNLETAHKDDDKDDDHNDDDK